MSSDPVRAARWAVSACFFVNGLIVGSWVPQVPLLAQRFGLGETALGLIILVLGIGAVTVMPLCGWLVGRTSSRLVVRVSALLSAFALPLIAFAPNLPLAVPAVALFGAFVGGMDVAMNSNAVVVERRLGSAIMSSSHGFWSLGGFVGAGVGGRIAEALGSQGHALVVLAVVLAILAVALPRLIEERRALPEASSLAPRAVRFPRKPGIYVIGILSLLCMAPEGAVLDWAALYLRQEMGASLATASLAFTFFSGTMALVRFLGDSVRNHLGAVRTVRVSGIVAAVGLLAAGLSTHPMGAIIAFALAGLGIANMVPIIFSAAGNQPDVPASIGMSVATTIGYSGILVAPSLIGFVAERSGFAPVYIFFALVMLVVVLLSHRLSAADRIAVQPSPDMPL